MLETKAYITELKYEPFALRPQIISIAIVFVILLSVFIAYYVKLKKTKENEAPKGLVLGIQIYIAYIRSLVIDILGPELEGLTPYFVFLFAYILLSNVIGIVGFENPTASLTVTLSMGLVMFIGTFVIGLKYQKLSWLKKFCVCIKIKGKKIPVMINPMDVMSQITPLISISFRLWGNIFAGATIGTLWFFVTGLLCAQIPVIGAFNILGGLTIPAINIYFDLLCGVIQALVFTLLTMVYWTLEKGDAKPQTNQEENVPLINRNLQPNVVRDTN